MLMTIILSVAAVFHRYSQPKPEPPIHDSKLEKELVERDTLLTRYEAQITAQERKLAEQRKLLAQKNAQISALKAEKIQLFDRLNANESAISAYHSRQATRFPSSLPRHAMKKSDLPKYQRPSK
ncbi:hypothetical protein H4R34_003099 [Dimargaris verticillata]|uniref:Uncharacterized protein n=1 Tax=Dimargaris verticillata TaxID=2761393 RepID=A0A9W8ECY5_9FUNG|nr:hypothetical protein H4R34_003099 [Dimargaris verticillata]